MKENWCWVFFAANAKPTSMRRVVAKRLAELEPVVIVEGFVSVLRDRKAPPLKARRERLTGVEDCYHYRPLHFPERLPGIGRILRSWNEQHLQQELEQLLPRDAKTVVCYDSPTQDHLVGKLREDISVYLVIDDLTMTVTGKTIDGELEAERRLLSRVDLVICVSDVLAQRLRKRAPSPERPPIRVLPNGYDEQLFDPNREWEEPDPLRGISRPRILVAGHISERIDWDGLIGASRLRPNWTWIFVGPADGGMKEKMQEKLGAHGFYHPPIPVRDVPAWIAHCDACAVPYRLNSFTQASNPLKAIEYLAMGAPILSTRVPALKRYDGVVEWVNEGEEDSYAKALDLFGKQLNNRELRALRQQAVAGDSLSIRVDQFLQIVGNAIS